MTIYEEAALYAYKLIVEKHRECNAATWGEAVAKYSNSIHAQKKGCPKGAFLGLCSEGLLKSIPSGYYTRSLLNKGYAVKVYKMLEEDVNWMNKKKTEIWKEVCKRSGAQVKHNGQIDVVFGLWKADNSHSQ